MPRALNAERRMTTQAQIAERIARKAHAGQTRRNGKTPYISHPQAVAARVAHESDETVAVAWLHDTLEDCGVTTDELRAQGISERVASAVLVLTHMPAEPYENYLRGVKADPIACKVKLADILHNLSDAPNSKQIRKYAGALLALTD